MTKEEVIATLVELTKSNVVDVTIPWKSEIRWKVKLDRPIELEATDYGLKAINPLWEIQIYIKSDPDCITLRRKGFKGMEVDFLPPYEWGAIVSFLFVDWNEFLYYYDKDRVSEKQGEARPEQLNLL